MCVTAVLCSATSTTLGLADVVCCSWIIPAQPVVFEPRLPASDE